MAERGHDKACLSTGGASHAELSVALTLISTEAEHFKVEEAAPIAVAAALDFLASPPCQGVEGLRVVFAAEEGSPALEALQQHIPTSGGGDPRLVVKACALPDVNDAGTPCAYLVNPCNWRLVGHGGKTNVLVNRAAGACLEEASLQGRTRALVAEPIVVKLPPESPLHARGVETIIQVLGPNLDPRFPDCLKDNQDEARRLLRLSFDRALACFWDLASSAAQGKPSYLTAVGSKGSAVSEGTTNARHVLPMREGSSAVPDMEPNTFAKYKKETPVPITAMFGKSSWKTVLLRYLEEPRSALLKGEVYYEDDLCVIIYDGYPKSHYHLLLIAKPAALDVKNVSALRGEHLPALRRLHSVGAAVAKALSEQGAGVVRCGYHAIPSLEPLHLHIISQDFDSPRIKKKSHWNSFTTDFFLESSLVEAELAELGRLEFDKDRYLRLESQPLRCFRCGQGMSNMPVLKAHNINCSAPLPQSPT